MNKSRNLEPLLIAGVYFAFSVVWIILSDLILGKMAAGFNDYIYGQLYKGLLFVVATSILLYVLVRLYSKRRFRSFTEIKESENRYRLLFENNPHPMWVYDLSTLRFLAVNAAAIQHYGYSNDEFLQMTVKDIRPKEDVAAFLQIVSNATTEVDNSGVWRHRKKDGTIISVQITAHSIGFDGRRARLVLADDITAKLQDEAQMRLQSSALQSAANGIVITDRDGVIQWVNPAFSKLTGYGVHEVLGKNPRFLKSGMQDGAFYKSLWSRILAGEVWKGEIVNRRKDGSPYTERMTITPLRDDRNAITHFIAIKEDITERKLVENALKSVEEKLRDIVEHSTNLFYAHTPDHVITYVSPQTRTFFDCEPEEALTRWTEFLTGHPMNERGIALTEEAIRTGKRQPPYQLELVGKKGRKIWVEVREAPIVRDGKTIAIVGSLSDISDRKKAEGEMQDALAWQEAIFEGSRDAVFITDADSCFVAVNDAACKLTGYTKDELLRMRVPDLHEEADLKAYASYFNRIIAGEDVLSEAFILRKDKTKVDTEFGNRRVMIGGNVYMHTTARDISDRKKAEEQIREQAALIDISSDAILVRNLQNEIEFWSKGAERMYGWTEPEALGKKGSELMLDENGSFGKVMAHVVARGEWKGEVTQRTKDGKKIVVNSRWTLMRDKKGVAVSILVVSTDVTDKKAYESQFLRAQRLESLGTLAGGIAHDLNNVLAPVMLSFEILKRTLKDRKSLQLLETAEKSAERGKHIVAQVLAFARGVDGERGPVQLRHLLTEVEQIFRETFPKSIEVKVHASKGLWPILGDATQLHQVLMNLCLNARDAMGKGGTLDVTAENIILDESFARLHPEGSAGATVVIKVSDTGPGIPKEILERIFDPFFTTKEFGKGTGLGLSTVHAIVKSHGGFVDVETDFGKGTTFKVYLPASRSSDKTESRGPMEDLPGGNKETILVVDDEASIREMTQHTLESYDYRVLTAKDGVDAVSVFAQHRDKICLVLMDIMMPIMDGSTAIRSLRKMNPDVKVIVASGLITDSRTHDLRGIEIQGVLSKPYTVDQLLRKLRDVLTEDCGRSSEVTTANISRSQD